MTQLALPLTTPALNRETQKMSRGNDPASSHEAAERMVVSGARAHQAVLVLEAVTKYPGRSSKQLAHLAGIDRHTVARRLPELEAKHLIVRTRPLKGGDTTWDLPRGGMVA